ncbi:MAG TPA: CinA family protein [Rhizomicrobium sp.]|jgi:nicotinamide-nucleotide amidase|nr:CinA family protein [Rhizomicrobium sp.]
MFETRLLRLAEAVLEKARAQKLRLAAAESCTGGLVAALLTEIPGASDAVERGFVVYSNAAKSELLGVDAGMIAAHGAVSDNVARAMAEGAIRHSAAQLAVAVTGIAGPGGGTPEKPVGLVHIAAAREGRETLHERHLFGPGTAGVLARIAAGEKGRPGRPRSQEQADSGRSEIRIASAEAALRLLLVLLD